MTHLIVLIIEQNSCFPGISIFQLKQNIFQREKSLGSVCALVGKIHWPGLLAKSIYDHIDFQWPAVSSSSLLWFMQQDYQKAANPA